MMKEIKGYKITYTSIGNEIGEIFWELGDRYDDPVYQEIADDIKQFIQSGKWKDESSCDRTWDIDWGYYFLWELPNLTQYTFYYEVVGKVAIEIGKRCFENDKFAKQLMKVASVKAKEKDEEFVEELMKRDLSEFVPCLYDVSSDELKKAKRRIRYRKQNGNVEETIEQYARTIEQFRIYEIVGMEPYTRKVA